MAGEKYHHGDLKSELIREGLKILDQEGYEGLSLRKVAKNCGVSQTAPYRHFKDKNELIQAITAEALRSFNECLEQASESYQENPEKKLSEMGVAYIQFFVENPAYLRLLFFNDFKNKICMDFCNQQDRFKEGHPFYTFKKAVEQYHEALHDPGMGIDELTLYCWGLVHGIAILIANHEIKLDKDYMDVIRNLFKNLQ